MGPVCTIDWTAVFAGVQAFFIAGGTVFAVWQYLAYKKNEEVKRTLRLLSNFNVVRHLGPSDKEMTAAGALALMQTAYANIAAFKSGSADFMAGRQTTQRQEYLVNSDAVVAVTNYYTDAARLARRGLIDVDLFMESQSYMMTLMMEPAKALFVAEGRPYDFAELEEFVAEGRRYLGKHPVA
jgi:hypothetical protein